MALNELSIKQELLDFFRAQNDTEQEDPEKAINDLSSKLASVIVKAIKSADIIVPISGISVLTAAPGLPSLNVTPLIFKNSIK